MKTLGPICIIYTGRSGFGIGHMNKIYRSIIFMSFERILKTSWRETPRSHDSNFQSTWIYLFFSDPPAPLLRFSAYDTQHMLPSEH